MDDSALLAALHGHLTNAMDEMAELVKISSAAEHVHLAKIDRLLTKARQQLEGSKS